MMALYNVEFIPRKYKEEESYLCLGDPEPNSRSQDVIFQSNGSRWYIKVTFKGTVLQPTSQSEVENGPHSNPTSPRKNKTKRRLELQAMISCVDFRRLPLIDNTVTEIELILPSAEQKLTDVQLGKLPLKKNLGVFLTADNGFRRIVRSLRYKIHEDSSRVRFPPYTEEVSLPMVWLSEINTKTEIIGGVFEVRFDRGNGERSYILKEIDRPFYTPRDTEVIQQELRNLRLFRGIPSIVQLVAVVISTSPYQTVDRIDNQVVIRGILLEHHPGGSLEHALQEMDKRDIPWRGWPLQIAEGLDQLHLQGITHMDLKPSNVVISEHGNAVLIDISGIGGVSHKWLAPELRGVVDPLSLPLEARRWNDIWAYGQLLLAMAECLGDGTEAELLKNVAADATKEDPALRIGLSCITSKFRRLSATESF